MSDNISLALCSLLRTNKLNVFGTNIAKTFGATISYVSLTDQQDQPTHDFGQYDAVILIHPVEMGRCSLTDVHDARYDKLLPHLAEIIGKF